MGANYGIAEYYNNVVNVLVRIWDIKNLHPSYPEAQASLERLNRYMDRLARLAAATQKRMGSPQDARTAAVELLGYDSTKSRDSELVSR
jgi:prefoldin subunit 5